MSVRHLLSVADLSPREIFFLLDLADKVKKHPEKFRRALFEKVLLTFFQMPSLRTEVSFDVAMFTMGGEIVDYHSESSPWAKGKESIEDVGRVVSRYVDAVMVRMHDHQELLKFAHNCSVPVINGLTSFEHPCQVLSDMQTVREKLGKLRGLRLAYFGDGLNNVTHSLLLLGALLGVHVTVASPLSKVYAPDPAVVAHARALAKKFKTGAVIALTDDPFVAAKNVDIVYTDSWMSYRIPLEEKGQRVRDLQKFQVSQKVMRLAKRSAIFMHDLPAVRGMEVAADVIDGGQSVVFDQAENRLHMEKAVLLWLLGKK